MPKFDRLFIAEKASVGKALADFLGRTSGSKVTPQGSFAVVGNDVVVSMSGHLLEVVEAHEYDPRYKSWRLDDLPIVPNPFVLVPKREPKSRAPEKVRAIAQLLKDCTSVVGVGDPDAEGQLLQDELLLYLGNKKPVMRLWANALDDTTLKKAYASMKPNSEYRGWYEMALARSQADWLYGINMTRACALHARAAGAPQEFKVTVGRVQTPTLWLVVTRELEIRSFVPVDYHVPYIGLATDPRFRATWLTVKGADGAYEDPRVDAEGRLVKKPDADAIVAAAKSAGKATVVHADTKAGTESAPLPFSGSTLQAHCSRLFGLGAKLTADTAQALYLKKLTTYPRVDTEYLPESQHADVRLILASLGKATLPPQFAACLRGANPALRSRAWNDSKVTAHHAIIPAHLDRPADLATLSDVERKVYYEILKRYLLQFWPAAKFLATEVVLACGTPGAEELYSAKGRVYTDDGWRAAFAGDDEESGGGAGTPKLPALTKGQVVALAEAGAQSKRTAPPQRYDDGTLITAMKSIHQHVKNPEYRKRLKEGVGIGTEATRAPLIEELLRRGTLLREGKELAPSPHAIELICALPDVMKTPDLTASWQQRCDDVKSGQMTHPEFIAETVKWLHNLLRAAPRFFKPGQFPGSKDGGKRAGGIVETEHKCFGNIGKVGCGSPLRLIEGTYGPFFGCGNPDCKKVFRSVEGRPVEKTERPPEPEGAVRYDCQVCKKGFLRQRNRTDGSGSFWGCSSWTAGCKAIYNDDGGKPDLEGRTRGGGSGGRGGGPRSSGQAPRGRPSRYTTPTMTPN